MKTKRTKPRRDAGIRRRALASSAEACPVCDGALRERRGALRYPVNGEDIVVGSTTFQQCADCKEKFLRLDDARRLQEAAIENYRHKYGLLSAGEIRSIRERLGMTQAAMAGILRLGANTLSRWESGRNVQSAALDVLLRMIRDVPECLRYLRRQAA